MKKYFATLLIRILLLNFWTTLLKGTQRTLSLGKPSQF
jgi:hypothetical protein